MKKLLSKLAFAGLILAGLYQIPVNLALNLPVTQERLNALQPDRFAVTWKRAWSWYPFRVHLQGVAADGQAPNELWQVDATAAAASVSLLPLLAGEIRVEHLNVRDVSVHLRPRPTPEWDYADLKPYFATIRNRDPEALAETPAEETGAAPRVVIEDVHVTGKHEFWIHHVRGAVQGALSGRFSLDPGSGQIGLSGGELDLALTGLHIGGDRDVTSDAWIRGKIDIPPANLAELPATKAIKLPEIDAELDVPVEDLHFLNLLFGTTGVMDLSGKGRLRGRLVQSGGEQRVGTDLIVEAPELRLGLARFDFAGDGAVELKTDESDENLGDLSVHFNAVEASLRSGTEGDWPQLFEGRDLTVVLHADTSDGAKERKADAQLTLSVPSVRVQDLSLYNALIPEKWGVDLVGGQGELSGRLIVGRRVLVMELDLSSDASDVRFKGNHITTDLSLALRAQAKAGADDLLDLTGTLIRFEDARVGRIGQGKGTPWTGELAIEDSRLTIPIPADGADRDFLKYVVRTLSAQGFGKLLEDADGRLGARLSLSRLDWISSLLGSPLGLTLAGGGEMKAGLVLEDGLIGKGTELRIEPQQLGLGLLDHSIDGRGHATLAFLKGGRRPSVRLDMELADATVERSGDSRPEVDQMHLKAAIVAESGTKGDDVGATIDLGIPSARIPDIGAFNAYLPPDTPVKLLSGEASLTGDIQLGLDSAGGELLVKANDMRIGLDDENLSGDMRFHVLLHGGAPADMRFDISGSRLVLDDFRVAGETASYEEDG